MPDLDAITTVVGDMHRTLEFYRLLGFEIPLCVVAEGYTTIRLRGDLRFVWNADVLERRCNPSWQPGLVGRMGISVRCATPREVDTLYRMILLGGYRGTVAPFDTPWGARQCRVLDPDGNAVDVFAPLP